MARMTGEMNASCPSVWWHADAALNANVPWVPFIKASEVMPLNPMFTVLGKRD
jgi:hypothetical protein|tara:strand:- start:118 stop:276 length:159 start_codon:yes stop_codon:yes gene_type:complete